MKKKISWLAGIALIAISLNGCSSGGPGFEKVLKDCNVALGGLRTVAGQTAENVGYAEDTAPTEDSVSGITGNPVSLLLDVTSLNDKVGLNIVASQCVLQGLGLTELTINTIWADQKNIDLAYKTAVANYKKATSSLKKAKAKVSSIQRTNGNIASVASKWAKEYKSDPTCYYDYDYEAEEDIYEWCSYSDWLEENKDWYWGDPMNYTSSSSGAKSQVQKLETTVKKGVVFPKDKLGIYQPVGQDNYSIAWLYSRKQGVILALTKN